MQSHLDYVVNGWNACADETSRLTAEELFGEAVSNILLIPESYRPTSEESYDPTACPDWVDGAGVSHGPEAQIAVSVDNGMYLVYWLFENHQPSV